MDSQHVKEELYSSITEWQRGLLLVGEEETLCLSNLYLPLGDLLLLRLKSGGRGQVGMWIDWVEVVELEVVGWVRAW